MAPGCDRIAMELVKPFGSEGTLRKDKWRDLLQQSLARRGHREASFSPEASVTETGLNKDLDDHIAAALLALDIDELAGMPAKSDSYRPIRTPVMAYLNAASKDTDRASVCWAAVLLYNELGVEGEEELILTGLTCLGAAQLFDGGVSRRHKLAQVAAHVSGALATHLREHPFFIPLHSVAVYPSFLSLLLWSWDIAFTLYAMDGRDQGEHDEEI